MGKIRKTYTEEFKYQAVQMYLHGEIGGGYRAVAEELGIERTILFRWIHTYQKEGREGLKEKRGKTKGSHKRNQQLSDQEKIQRLEAEVEYLKKLLKARKEK